MIDHLNPAWQKLRVPYTIFPIGFLDYDNDGWLDIFFAGGAVMDLDARKRAGDRYPLGQAKGLLLKTRDGRFEDVGVAAGETFGSLEVSRGMALGDMDNDGYTDILLANNNGPTRLLINNLGHRKHWLGLRMIGEKFNRDMLGTRVALFRPNGPTLWRRVTPKEPSLHPTTPVCFSASAIHRKFQKCALSG